MKDKFKLTQPTYLKRNAVTGELTPVYLNDALADFLTYNRLTITDNGGNILNIAANKEVRHDNNFYHNGGDGAFIPNGNGHSVFFPTSLDTLVGEMGTNLIQGLKTLQHNSLATTPHDGLILTNDTLATAAVPVQMSPRKRIRGHGWNTTATAHDETVDWTYDILPVSGAVVSSIYRLRHSLNGGAYTDALDLTSQGTLHNYGGRITKVTIVTNTYTILTTDYTVVCNKTTDFTVTLPTAVVGQIFNIKNINTGIVTVDGESGDTIDGELTQTLEQWENLQIQCISANTWVIL